jgi:hypothetical protein
MSTEAVLGLSRFVGFCKSPRLLIGVMQQGFAGLNFDPTEPSKMKRLSLRLTAFGEPTVKFMGPRRSGEQCIGRVSLWPVAQWSA